MSGREPMVTCGGCLKRRRSVVLWYLPRKRQPRRHVGLPEGWTIVQGSPFCAECSAAAEKRAQIAAARRPT